MASCRSQDYNKWLREQLGIIIPTLWNRLFKADHLWIGILLGKNLIILRFDFNCAHVIIWNNYYARKKKTQSA